MIGPLSGYLLASPDDEVIARRAFDNKNRPTSKNFLEFIEPFEGTRFWEHYCLQSDRSLVEESNRRDQHPPFRYPVYCARSGSKVILLTEKKRLTDLLIELILNKTVFPNLKHVSFQIEKMISAFEKPDSLYRVTSLTGRFAGPDRDLRTTILYGSEVTNSVLFREHRHLFNFYICGLAERAPDDPFFADYGEIARLGSDGSITVQSFNRKKASDLNKIVNHLIANKWVDDWVVPWAGDTE